MNNSVFSHPNFTRVSLGYEPIFRMIENLDTAEAAQGNKYPPHNLIALDEEIFLIEMAVAGFKRTELEITHHQGKLTVSGEKAKDANKALHVNWGDGTKNEITEDNYIHRGISTRSFQKSFNTSEHVVVTGAAYEDGILTIAVELQIPESEKPKKIKIK